MDHMKWRAKPYVTMPWALRLATDPRLLDKVEDLLGPDLLLFTSTFFVKEANSASWADWHQDSTYHGYDPVEHVNCWIALTDATEEAGCMEMLLPMARFARCNMKRTLSRTRSIAPVSGSSNLSTRIGPFRRL